MNYRAAARQISKGEVLPLYVCYGAESFLMQEFIQYTSDKLVEADQRDFAISKYDLSETSLDDVLDDAETFPFMVTRKLIIAHDAAFLTSAKESSKIEHRIDRLLQYIESPVDYSTVILTISAEKLDERKKIVKALKEKDWLIPFPSYTAEELVNWTMKQADKFHITFAQGAIDHLIASSGTDLQLLHQEISKLSLFVGESGVVTSEMVDRLVVRNTEQNVFVLVEEIIRTNIDKAIEILHELLKKREEPIKILMLIARQFRIILQVKELTRQGRMQKDMAGLLGLHPYAVKVAMEQSKKYNFEELSIIMARLSDLDFKIKSGKVDKVAGLELFLLRLAS